MNKFEIALPGSDNATYTLGDFLGQKLILYFYPKDHTAGCTLEANEFTSLYPEFKELGYTIIGVSKDSVKTHQNFISKQGIGYLLLSDKNKELIQAFDVLKEKSMYGKKYMGIERSTFIINETGKIVKEYRKVKARGHAQKVLDDVKAL
jgi:peroxiredoxin Q/BCP